MIHNGELTAPFTVMTGVRQGCILSPMLFILVMDWVIGPQCRTQEQESNGPLFPGYYQDFADDIALLSHSYKHAQEKVQSLAMTSRLAGL